MQLLRLGAAQIDGQLDGLHHVLAVDVDPDGLAAGVGVHLLFLAVQVVGRQGRDPHVVAQDLLEGGGVPRAGEDGLDAAVPHAGQTRAVGVDDEVGVLVQVDQVVGHLDGVLAAEVGAQLFLGAVAEQGAAVAEIEGRQIPGVGEGEADHPFGQHGVQALDVLFGKDALVIVHEPGVGGEGHAVDVVVHRQRREQRLAVGGLDLVGVDAAELGHGPGVDQVVQHVVGEHEHIGARLGILRDGGAGGGLVDDAVDKGDVPLGVQLGKAVAAGLQPFAAVLGLVEGRAPDHETDVFAPARAGASAQRAARGGRRSRRRQTDELPSGQNAGRG